MKWTVSTWVAAALLALCRGQSIQGEGNWLSVNGFHLCTCNETRNVSFLVVDKVIHTVTKPCDGWLAWEMCTVQEAKIVLQTQNKTVWEQVPCCCDGYVPAGGYCVLPVNRSGEFTAKPGSCPNTDGADSGSVACQMDVDCPGWQKCCKICGQLLCVDPATSANYPVNGGNRVNATITVKTDYQHLMMEKNRLQNHLRLLHSLVSGALESGVTIYYLTSWLVFPFRSATSLLIDYRSPLSLHNVTSRLHLLLTRINEVSSITVRDIDECAHGALRRCSLQARCNNTEGSYQCECFPCYIDADSSNPGANCTANVTTECPPLTDPPPANRAHTAAFASTRVPTGTTVPGISSSSESGVATAPSSTSSVPYNSSPAPPWTSFTPHPSMSSTVETPEPTNTCPPPSLSSLWAANVTGTSFSACWSSPSQANQTYLVAISNGSGVILSTETNQTMVRVRNLKPGIIFNVTVTPCACGNQGTAHQMSVKTDAHALDATVRITNIPFIADLYNPSTQAYQNLARNISEEILQSQSPEMRALIDSGQVRIEIRGFSSGSVVVYFTFVSDPTHSHHIRNVSTVVLDSLKNSSKLAVEANSTNTTDSNECTSSENDCSQWANCTNTMYAYTCACLDEFMDISPERPGRACQVVAPMEKTIPPVTVSSSPVTLKTSMATGPANTTAAIASETVTTTIPKDKVTTGISTPALTPSLTAPTVTTTAQTNITTSTTTNETAPTNTTTAQTNITTSTTTNETAPTNNTTAQTNVTTSTTTNETAPTNTTTAQTKITTSTTTNETAPTNTTTAQTNITTSAATEDTTQIILTTVPTSITAPTTTTASTITNNTASASTSTEGTTITYSTTANYTAPTITPTAQIPMAASTDTINITSSTSITHSTTIEPTTTPASSITTNDTIPIIKTTHSTITSAPATTSTTSLITTTSSKPIVTLATGSPTPTIRTTKASTTTDAPTTSTPATTSTLIQSLKGYLSVQCRVAAITVSISKEYLLDANIQENALYLGWSECGVNGDNATHVQLTVAWDECNTTLVNNETHYTASVTLFNNMDPYPSPQDDVKVPKLRLEVPVICTYMRSKLISVDSGSVGYDMVQELITGSGSFQVRVELMDGTVPLPHNYSLSPLEAVVVKVSLNTSSDLIKLVINKCWATTTRNPNDVTGDSFLENSCSTNTFTKVLVNGNSSTSRVSVQIFSIVNKDMIFLHCQVQICVQTGNDSCVPECGQRTARSGKMVERSLASVGPLFKSEEESLDEDLTILQIAGFSCLGVGLSLFFIIGFACLFFYQRNRIGNYNFNVKPKEENFTYLVFNT